MNQEIKQMMRNGTLALMCTMPLAGCVDSENPYKSIDFPQMQQYEKEEITPKTIQRYGNAVFYYMEGRVDFWNFKFKKRDLTSRSYRDLGIEGILESMGHDNPEYLKSEFQYFRDEIEEYSDFLKSQIDQSEDSNYGKERKKLEVENARIYALGSLAPETICSYLIAGAPKPLHSTMMEDCEVYFEKD